LGISSYYDAIELRVLGPGADLGYFEWGLSWTGTCIIYQSDIGRYLAFS